MQQQTAPASIQARQKIWSCEARTDVEAVSDRRWRWRPSTIPAHGAEWPAGSSRSALTSAQSRVSFARREPIDVLSPRDSADRVSPAAAPICLENQALLRSPGTDRTACRLRKVLLMSELRSFFHGLAVMAAFTLASSACGDASHDDTSSGTPRGYEQNLALWTKQAPKSYVIETCPHSPRATPCTIVVVKDGKVTAAREHDWGLDTWTDSKDPASVEEPIGEMFDAIKGGDSDQCKLALLEFDAKQGFVKSYGYDCGQLSRGEEVLCFVADSDDIDRCDPPTQLEVRMCKDLAPCMGEDFTCANKGETCYQLKACGGKDVCVTAVEACQLDCQSDECGTLDSEPPQVECD
jgi:hypothetical protein